MPKKRKINFCWPYGNFCNYKCIKNLPSMHKVKTDTNRSVCLSTVVVQQNKQLKVRNGVKTIKYALIDHYTMADTVSSLFLTVDIKQHSG